MPTSTTTTTAAPGATTTTARPTTGTTTGQPGSLDGAVKLTQVAIVEAPTALAYRAGDDNLYVTEKVGRVRVLKPDTADPPTYTVDSTPLLDISDDVTDGGEQGLLGLAFSSDGQKMYVAFTSSDSGQHQEVDEFTLSNGKVQASSRRTIITVADFAPNHNGGDLVFGPDGYLYYSMGDGGGAGDPHLSGQDPSDLLGDLLRIDPHGSTDRKPYATPSDNPFASGGGAPEVWTYGLRNPWRFSFDRETGDLWIGDVGQGLWEEIDMLPAAGGAGSGANLGWSTLEGLHAFHNGGGSGGPYVDPVFEYGHDDGGCSVTGGFVYRGARIPALVGAYVWADFCIGDINVLVQQDGVETSVPLGIRTDNLGSFGQDVDGELYALSLSGPIYRLDP